MSSGLLNKSLKGGLIVVGNLNLGGGIDPVYNAINVAELAIEKGATTLLIPISARRQMNELTDERATKLVIPKSSEGAGAVAVRQLIEAGWKSMELNHSGTLTLLSLG